VASIKRRAQVIEITLDLIEQSYLRIAITFW
jgi:hypothetical protein